MVDHPRVHGLQVEFERNLMIRICPKGHITGYRYCSQCSGDWVATTPVKIVVRTEGDKEKRTVRELRRMGKL